MAKSNNMKDLLKQRMSAAQQVSEMEIGNRAYESLIDPLPAAASTIRELPVDKLRPFFTTDIGFHPYSPEKLRAFSQQLLEQGLLERIIVRSIPDSDEYEILAGHNRTAAWRMAGHDTIPAEVVVANDARAIIIATATNLLRRQELTIIERGKAYKAMLEAKRRQGERTDLGTSGENRQKFLTREIVADFFGVTEYEIRKAVKLAGLIPPLADILESDPRHLPLSCADMIADYDEPSQEAFVEMCRIEGYRLNKATLNHITQKCPPPTADKQAIYTAWREARTAADKKRSAPSKKITFDRRKFAPYLEQIGSEAELEEMFLEFLKGVAHKRATPSG
ncbi:MAG: ParB N-terminal domain-containing protein [Vescimonas sp.]|uniref:ParB/RepB/Spo0J family partition protein n=1 Tax=Vescimonas sp. TaxID=2892404 RepID=UPI002A91CFDC|nr:ParB N-terminal domain-containing protein [Vescimonas sp.]MDY5334375.1 ParB N-terminal domain-containing protein [Vescimonas sp.]